MSTEQEQNKKDFYQRLKDELEKNDEWPLKYMYKFIVPNQNENEERVKKAFQGKEYEYHKNFSKSGKYISLTFVTQENNANDIIDRYRSLENIEGLVAL